jgi:imidazolonepropionase-like amidohydrolase
MSLVISEAAVIDGIGEKPIDGCSIWIENGRIRALGRSQELNVPPSVKVIDARGKYVIPGLMNANVHLCGALNLETIARYFDRFDELIAESSQVALRNGLTTVFDTHGPRRFLMAARDEIASGRSAGSRFYCAGNIIGLDGPFSLDFFPKALDVASTAFARRVNACWAENVGRHLMWLTPEQLAREVRSYIQNGIDFVKYASNDHFPGAFLAFSPRQQACIVEEAHRAGITAQAHSMSVEGLRIAIEAGCDLVTHCNITGPVAIPEETLELFATRKTGAVVFPFTEQRLAAIMANVSDAERTMWQASDVNARNLIRTGAKLLLANDGTIWPSDWSSDPQWGATWITTPGEDNLNSLSTGHFAWFKAMEEKGCAPIEMLRAATRNIAEAYGKQEEVGTLEPGKIADMLILDQNPLRSAENYRSIRWVVKAGEVVDRDTLPLSPIMTRPPDGPTKEECSYVPFLNSTRVPMCPMCLGR